MKKFINKVQEVRQKAAEVAAVIESAPAKAAELRDAVMATAGQMHQMRRTVQEAATGLVANNEERLIAALHEIDHSTDTFRAAGYELENVEMELATPQRLIVHLEKVSEVSASTMRSLADANASRATTHAILTALLKAEDMSGKVALANLYYHQLVVYLGPVPTVRLCWCAPSAATPPPIPASPAATAAPASSGFSSMFGQSSFFESRAALAPRESSVASSPVIAASASAVAAAPAASHPPAAGVKEDPLARFKKMPDLSRRS
jgi:hypothetical protein